MDHKERDRQHTSERYLLDLLSPEERAAFEEHFVGCADCIASIELAEALQEGLASVAAEAGSQAKQPRKPLRTRIGEWSLRHSKWEQTGVLVLACALFTAGPFLFFYSRMRAANQRADMARAESASWERRYFSERENADRLKRLVDQVRAGQNMVTQLVAAKPEVKASGAPVVSLEAGKTVRIEPVSSAQWLLLVAPAKENDPKLSTAQLYGDKGNLLAGVAALKPNAHGEIAVSVMASLFETGYYALVVDGATYPFYVTMRK